MRFKNWLVLLLCLFITACGKPAPNLVGTDLTGTQFGKPFTLADHTGKARTMADFKGKVVVMFFGYTHCPDVCPTTMSDLKQAMKLLGDKANQVQVLFMTVDPERDTQAVLAQFVPSFDQRFIGLTGSVDEVKANMAEYKVYASKVDEGAKANEGASNYSIDHSAGLYVFDKTGAPRIYLNYGQKPAEIASDLTTLLN